MTKKRIKNIKRIIKTSQTLYSLNPAFEFFEELKNLILKSSPAKRNEMIRKISKLGLVKLAIISGMFLNINSGTSVYETPADLFVVGNNINKRKLKSFLASLEAEAGREVKFSLMDKEEFHYRYGMFDRFIRVLLEGPHEKIINKLGL